MTATQNDGFTQTTATGGETTIDFDFLIYGKDDIAFYKTSALGVITLLTRPTNYDINDSELSDPAGGAIDLVTPASAGEVYTAISNISELRSSDFQQGGDFFAATLNTNLDRLTRIAQQHRRDLNKTMSLRVDSIFSGPVFMADPEDTKVQYYDAASNQFLNGPTVTDISGANASAVAAAASAAAAAISASAASTSASAAATSASSASTSATTATTQASNAATSASSASTSATNASNSASAASTSETNAASSASAASTSASSASTSATNASNSASAASASATAAAASAAQLIGTSTSSVAIGTGSKAFTTQSGKFFAAGTWLLITSDANPAVNYMHGVVTAYSGTSLTVNVTNIGGAGTLTDWTIRVSGTQGATGAAGTLDFTVLSAETAIAVGDLFVINDISEAGGTNNKITFQSVMDGINVLTAETAPAAGDKLALIDVSASNNCDSITLENVLKVINDLTADGSPATGDFVVTYDVSASAAKKVTLANVVALATAGGIKGLQKFTSNGTYTRTSGATKALMITTGGGGGGGGADTTANASEVAAGGGSCGGTAIKLVDVTSIASATVVIGAGGTAGNTSGSNGGTGGETYVWDGASVYYCYFQGAASGGTGTGSAAVANTSKPGGDSRTPQVSSVGDILINASSGQAGIACNTDGSAMGGNGMASFWGGAGRGGLVSIGVQSGAGPEAGQAPGSGGGGAASTATTGNAGAAGADGIVLILEF